MDIHAELADLIGREVVIDTHSPYVYLGTLESFTENFVTLSGVDVHDMTGSHSTKELYIMQARKLGIARSRTRVKLMTREVVSISRLEDVLVFE